VDPKSISDILLRYSDHYCQITRISLEEKNSGMENKVLLNISELRDIGRTVVSDKFPITTDSFWFALSSDIIVNPFDFVSVENVHNTHPKNTFRLEFQDQYCIIGKKD
jgi:hypothetical protein